MITATTRLVALLGHPVDHSLSPRMQNAAFAARALDWAYVACDVAPGELEAAVAGLGALGFAGANVTIPHKGAVTELCDELDDLSRRSCAVNTLVFREDGRIVGANSDGPAIAAAVEAAGAHVLVLGRGGAARSVAVALEDAGAASVRLASRADDDWPPELDEATILVNATPLRDELPVAPRAGGQVVDLAYRPDGRRTLCALPSRVSSEHAPLRPRRPRRPRARGLRRPGLVTPTGGGTAERTAGLRDGRLREVPHARRRGLARQGRPEPRPAPAGVRPDRATGRTRRRRYAVVPRQAERARDPGGRALRHRRDEAPDLGRGGVQAERPDRRRLPPRLGLLPAGVREPRLLQGPEARPRAVHARDAHQSLRRAELPPNRPRDRRWHAHALPRRRRQGVRARLGRLLVRLLPRHPRARFPGHPGLAARHRRPPPLRPGRGARLDVRRLPVRPRARPRADDLHRVRPPARAPHLRRPRDAVGPGLVHRRRVHGEPVLLVRVQVAVAPPEAAALPVHRRLAAAQALLLPDGHVADPPGRRLQLDEDGRRLPRERAGLGADVLPVARPRRVRPDARAHLADRPDLPARGRHGARVPARRGEGPHFAGRERPPCRAALRRLGSRRPLLLLLRHRADPRHVHLGSRAATRRLPRADAGAFLPRRGERPAVPLVTLSLATAGESHGPALVAILSGLPAGLVLDRAAIDHDLRRRQEGYGRSPRQRIESDEVEVLAGLRHGRTLGTPLALVVRNEDHANWAWGMSPWPPEGDPEGKGTKSVTLPRPGHADLAGSLKFGLADVRDALERASARHTAVFVAAGAVAKALLAEIGVRIESRVIEVGGVSGAEEMRAAMDTIGGVVEGVG